MNNALENQQKSGLPFAIVSKAYSGSSDPRDRPKDGMRRLAELAHHHGMPVTWIVDPMTAELMGQELADWHGRFGDDIAMSLAGLPFEAEAFRLQREKLQKLCPWSEVAVSGQGGGKSEQMLSALEAAGIKGHWGYCWEQTYVDSITDYGQPPGLFFASPHSYKMPRPGGGGVVAMEWLSRDLNKAFWTGNPVHFAGEPDAFKVMGDWPDKESLGYFDHLVNEYLRNARAGQVIPFIFQEEAEQLSGMLGGRYATAWEGMLAWMEKALPPLASNPEIEFTTLGRLAGRMHAGEWAWPRLYRAKDRRCMILNDPRTSVRVYGAALEFPEILHYCAEALFATFVAGNPAPVRLIRYDRQQPCDVSTPLEGEPLLPLLHSLQRSAAGWQARVSALSSTPYALCIALEPGQDTPGRCVRNEDSFVWEFQAQAGTHTYTLPAHREAIC